MRLFGLWRFQMNTRPRSKHPFHSRSGKSLTLILLAAALLEACGGGSGASNTNPIADAVHSPPDLVAPTVVSMSPADNAVDVAIDASLRITFSEPMDSTSINGTTVKVRAGIVYVAGTIRCAYDTIIFTPSANWGFTTTYTVTISGGPSGVRDVSGNVLASDHNWTFSTGQVPDTTPPRVISTNPIDGDFGIPVDTTVIVTFSEAVTNVTAATFLLMDYYCGPVPGVVTVIGSTAFFRPLVPLTGLTMYTATVTTAVTDLSGNAPPSDYTWIFVTEGTVGDWW